MSKIPDEFKSFYKTVGGGEGNKCHYPTRLDTYGKGCYYNCKYCYSKKLLDFRKLWHPNNVAVADIEKIYRKIKKLPRGSVVRIGGMTDCFQPIEQKVMNTYHTIKALNEQDIHYLIVTKSPLIATKKYMEILDKKLAHIQISTPTTNNKVLKDTDNAPPYQQRKQAIETLQKKGYDISIRLSPFLYETADYKELNTTQADKCLVEFLRITPQIQKQIQEHINWENYTIKEGGYRHLNLEKKLEALSKLKFKQISVCDDVQDHYEYFNQHYNPNPNDCCNLTL